LYPLGAAVELRNDGVWPDKPGGPPLIHGCPWTDEQGGPPLMTGPPLITLQDEMDLAGDLFLQLGLSSAG